MKEKLYEEVGAVYRFFLGWRHATLGGIVVIVGGALSLTASIYKDSPELSFLVPLFASPFGIILWMIDVRTRSLYHAAIQAGKNLEGSDNGFFSVLSAGIALRKDERFFSRITHSLALFIIFWVASIGLLVLAFVLFRMHPMQRAGRSSETTPRASVSGTGTNTNADMRRVGEPPATDIRR
jgi:hypothetical protein